MGGTRFNARGTDEEGNAANFCELEHLIFRRHVYQVPEKVNESETVVAKTTIYSFVQVRGSMPFFWT